MPSIKFSRDVNGNKLVGVETPAGRLSIQCAEVLPMTHKISRESAKCLTLKQEAAVLREIEIFILNSGTKSQKEKLASLQA